MTRAEMEYERPRIGAIAPWFGAKRNLAAAIIQELGPHRAYWEPFCGSMAVLLAKAPVYIETVNDLNGDLVNLARVIQDNELGPRFYRRLRRTLMDEDLHREAHEIMKAPPPDPMDRAYWYFIESWIGRNGVSGTSSTNRGFCVRFTAGGGNPAVRFASAVDTIPTWRRRLRRVIILQKDAFYLLERIADQEGTAIYVDPPYFVAGTRYQHDFKAEDHSRLAEMLKRFDNARVVLSYYEDPRLDELYPTWTRRKIVVSKALAHQGRRGANDTKAVEVLLINGPSYAVPDAGGLFAHNNGK